MALVKIVLWKSYQKKDGTFALAIRITQNRKPRYVFTGKYILVKDWDELNSRVKRSHPNSARLNNLLLMKLAEANNIALETDTTNKNATSKEIQKKVKRKGGSVSFFQFGAERVKTKFLSGTFSVAKPELSILYNIREFINLNESKSKDIVITEIKGRRKYRISKSRKVGYVFLEEVKREFSKDKSLSFEDITETFLKKYKVFCGLYLGHKTRTITNQMIFIRTLFNLAVKDNLVDKKYYPFAGEKEKIKVKSGHKIGLTKDEIHRIEQLNLEKGTTIWHTRNIWLFAYYFAGIRISDVLEMKWSDFLDGRLFYTMNKNEKPVSLIVPDEAGDILTFYKHDKRFNKDFVFPYLKKANPENERDLFIKTRNASTLLNKYLRRIATKCKIEKNLTNHIARHSFGNVAGDAISPLMLQKLYRHSDLKTTINYQANFIHKDADDALLAVLKS